MTFLLPKPARGAHDIKRKLDRRKVESFEDQQKAVAKKRDGYKSRWPDGNPLRLRLESAHFKSKGMGGDHGNRSSSRMLITLDYLTHNGAQSIHSGHKKVKPLDAQRLMDGPCEFYERDVVRGRWTPWRLVGRELAVGLLDRTVTAAGRTGSGKRRSRPASADASTPQDSQPQGASE